MSEHLLAISGLRAGYGTTEILRGIDLTVGEGEIVAVLGSNGTGKSTLNRTISGVMRASHGTIRFLGAAIEQEPPKAIVARGLIHVPEGRRIFPNLTVRENLDLGAYRRARARRNMNRSRVLNFVFRQLLQEYYTLPEKWSLKALRSHSTSAVLGIRNLKVWSSYTGEDPEANYSTGNSQTDLLTAGPPMIVTVRLNVKY